MIIPYKKLIDTGAVVINTIPWASRNPNFDITYCCRPLARSVLSDNVIIKEQDPPNVQWVDKDGHDNQMNFCPFCGEKVQPTRESWT
jgi:hypothetical protein